MLINCVLGITVDVPAPSGNIYPRSVIEKTLEQGKLSGNIYVVLLPSDVENISFVGFPIIPLNKAIGIMRDYQIGEGGDVRVDIDIFQSRITENLIEFVKSFTAVPIGYGTVKDGISQDDYKMVGITFDEARPVTRKKLSKKRNK